MKKIILLTISVLFSISSLIASANAKFHSGFIYHFTKYIEWPVDMRNGDFVIAVVGNSEVIPYLTQLAKTKTVGGQKIVIKKCSSVAQAKGAHIMFVDDSKLANFATVKSIAQQGNTLLLTAKNNYGRNGSMINFFEKNGKIQFELNQSATKKAGLVISNKLVSLATLV